MALNGAAWARLRRLVLSEQPLCRECQREGRIRASLDVDHIDNDASNNDLSNLAGMCHSHHSRKTRNHQNAAPPIRAHRLTHASAIGDPK
ncbi:MAG: HNH endonuclease [Nitrosospira sp.]|nr:HNH endonuclease [Nitrosospira sp.]